jgi:hypothetical protein
MLCAPWDSVGAVATLLELSGLTGMVYALVVARRMRVQGAYKPEFEDWLFHLLLPFAAYAALAVSGIESRARFREALFAVGTAVLLLLFVGIHNAWDAVTYHVFVSRPKQPGSTENR